MTTGCCGFPNPWAQGIHTLRHTHFGLHAGIEEGCRAIDSAAGGLGGWLYAPGSTCNVATEDVVVAALNAKWVAK